jgi:hypothetical protein
MNDEKTLTEEAAAVHPFYLAATQSLEKGAKG